MLAFSWTIKNLDIFGFSWEYKHFLEISVFE